MAQRLITWILMVALTCNSSGIALAATGSQADHALIRERLDNFVGLAADLRSHIDRSQFDTDALLDKLGYDLDEILRFVAEDISFEPYQGLLRGPQGTLMSRAGNALDQSVLLAKLLNDAGFEARIAHGRLQEADVGRLLALTAPRLIQLDPFSDREAASAVLHRMGNLADMPKQAMQAQVRQALESHDSRPSESSLHKAVQGETGRIIQVLSQRGVRLGNPEFLESLRDEVRDYFWVEYRDGAAEWSEAHPAFGMTAVPISSAKTYFTGSIPAEWQHRVRIQASIVRLLGARSETFAIMEPWERPAANLAVHPVTYGHSPLSIPEHYGTPLQYLASGDTFVPVLDGALASEVAFDLSGNIIPMMAVQAAGADLVKTVSDKARVAESALAGIGSSEKKVNGRVGLSKVQIEITVIQPGGSERSFFRTIYDPCNEHRTTAKDTPCSEKELTVADKLALTRSTTLAVSVGSYPDSYVLDRLLERVLDNYELWKLYVDPEKRENLSEWSRLDGLESSWLGFLPMFQLFDDSLNAVSVYRSEPSVVLFQQQLDQGGGYLLTLDIVANTKRALQVEQGVLKDLPHALVYEGVWETAAENFMLTGSHDEASRRAFVLGRSDADAKKISIVTSAENAPKWAENVLKSSLDGEYLAIMTADAVKDGDEQAVWYRINSETGETLGMTADGKGGAVEYLAKLMVGVFVIAPIYVLGCMIAGGESTNCVMFVGKAVAVFGVGAFAFALSVFQAITFWPSKAY